MRFRPDQRALENGDSELASREKHILEEKQRARRKEHEKAGTHHKPVYFDEVIVGEGKNAERQWKFNGKYWIDRD